VSELAAEFGMCRALFARHGFFWSIPTTDWANISRFRFRQWKHEIDIGIENNGIELTVFPRTYLARKPSNTRRIVIAQFVCRNSKRSDVEGDATLLFTPKPLLDIPVEPMDC
jgi:hypothetical protein